MYSMKIYTLIMKSFDWEGMREDLHQHFQECNIYRGLGQPMDSLQESSQPALPLLERGECSCTTPCVGRNIMVKDLIMPSKLYFLIYYIPFPFFCSI